MKIDPKISVKLVDKNGKRRMLCTFAAKIKNFGNLSLVKKAKLGRFKSLTIKFFYGRDNNRDIDNEMNCSDFYDLIWAFKAFSDEFLYLTDTSRTFLRDTQNLRGN